MPAGGNGGSRIGRLDDRHVPGRIWELPGVIGALAWTAEGDALYAASADTGAIHRLEPGRGTPRLLTRMPPGGGRPAALALDDEGGIWTALRDGWSVARLTADGEVDRVLPLPVPRPTGLGFGGPDRATLYVATARDGVGLDVLSSAPLSGRLLALSPGVRGQMEATARV
jgi:sugar lactone lactonase YvrE